jgi:hypothetical protein
MLARGLTSEGAPPASAEATRESMSGVCAAPNSAAMARLSVRKELM